ncbi:MAG TPA: hypothetical protein VIU40_14050, partial [Geobacteraceae bacterium]
AQALLQDQVAHIETHGQHHVSGKRREGNQVKERIGRKVLDEIVKDGDFSSAPDPAVADAIRTLAQGGPTRREIGLAFVNLGEELLKDV